METGNDTLYLQAITEELSVPYLDESMNASDMQHSPVLLWHSTILAPHIILWLSYLLLSRVNRVLHPARQILGHFGDESFPGQLVTRVLTCVTCTVPRWHWHYCCVNVWSTLCYCEASEASQMLWNSLQNWLKIRPLATSSTTEDGYATWPSYMWLYFWPSYISLFIYGVVVSNSLQAINQINLA